jgi:uroporphyrinogen-III synthase
LKIRNILVSQPQPSDFEKSPYAEIARKFNVDITFRQLIRIEGVPAKEFRKDRINILDYSAIVFTSKNAVDQFFRICKEMRVEVPETMKYFSISESTAYYLQKYVQFRKRKIFHSKENFSLLVELIRKHKNEKFLLPCSDVHKQDVPKMLEDNKVAYKKAVIYRTLANDMSDIDITKFDMIVFFSPAGIKSLFKNYPEFKQKNTVIAALGPTVAKAVKDAGLRLDIEAPTKEAPSIITAIEQYLSKEFRKK